VTVETTAGTDLSGRPAERQREPSAPSPAFAALLLVLLAALAYVNTLSHPFVYDDLPLVLKNPEIRSLSNLPLLLGFHDGRFELRSRFTRDVTYALEFAVAGPWPPIYRITNIALHAVNALLLLLFLRRATGDRLLAVGAAVLFAIHPIGTDVVTQISGRREILATLFALATALSFQAYAARGGAWRFAGGLACLFLGVFSKEMAVMAPLAFVATDLLAALRNPPEGAALGRRLADHLQKRRVLYGSILLAMIAITAVRLELAEGGSDRAGTKSFYETRGEGLTILDRARIAGLGLRLLVAPIGQSVDYSYDALGLAGRTGSTGAALDLAVLGAAALATAAGLRRRSWLGAGGVLFFLLYLPTSGIIPWHEIFAERFLYLPQIGFDLAVAGLLVVGVRRPELRRACIAAGVAAAVALISATVIRNEVWSTSERLWADTVRRYPGCARAHKALADQYLAGGRADAALEHYREAVRILPVYHDARVGVGSALVALGRPEEGKRAFEEVLARRPEHAKTLNDLGMVLEAAGDFGAATAYFERASRSDPTLAEPYNNLARIHAMRGDIRGAIRLYEEAIARDPSLVPALRNLATLYRYALHDEERASRYDETAAELLAVR